MARPRSLFAAVELWMRRAPGTETTRSPDALKDAIVESQLSSRATLVLGRDYLDVCNVASAF